VDLRSLYGITSHFSVQILLGVTIVAFFLALFDFWYQRHDHRKNLRMTKQEVKDEHKQTEGDPQIKARIRSLRLDRARKRMIANVANADVVVTNPTHYAVALEYDASSMGAPKLLAKGADFLAQRIREIAEENKIPIVSNPPLARAIYASVEIDQEIKPEHYKAMAEVIGFVMRVGGEAARRKFTVRPGADGTEREQPRSGRTRVSRALSPNLRNKLKTSWN
jgi:flagellar biosynthetic protein FlhB